MLRLRTYCLLLLLLLTGCNAVDETDVLTLDQGQLSMQSSGGDAPGQKTVWQPVQLPDNWGVSRPGVGGTGVYRFKLDLNVAPNRLWALLLPGVSNNVAVYLNDALLGSFGDFKGYSSTWNTPVMMGIPSGLLKPGNNIIDIKVMANANFGRMLPPILGAEEYIRPIYEQRYFVQIVLSEICAVFALTMGVCMLMLWWYRRDSLYFWFAIGGISWAFYALYFFVTELPLPIEYWIRFCLSCGCIMLSAMFIFICQFMNWKHKHAEPLFMGYGLLGIVLLFLSPDDQLFNGFMWIMVGYVLIAAALGVALIHVLRLEQSRQHAITSLIGIGANIGLGLHDWVNIFFSLNHPYILQYGQPLLFLVMGRHLFKDYISALRKAEATNAELDERVRVREQALQRSMQLTKQAEDEKLLLKERERIMADIHDGVGGHLISALAIAESSADGSGQLVSQTIHQAMDELRLVIDSLDPDECKLSQMLAAFRYRYDQRLERQGITISWKFEQLDTLDEIGPEKALQLLRILQELITNIIKHAQADHISVWMGIQVGSLSRGCWLSVADNGIGFDVDASLGRGVGNLRRRAEAVGGSVQFSSQETGGTLVELVFPLGSI